MIDLSVLDYQDDGAWRWQLNDADGTVLAQHEVRLDRGSTEFRLLTDLYRNLWRLEADPARRARSEQALLSRVGRYIAGQVFGPVHSAIAIRAPDTVRVMVPPGAVGLLAMPLELADGGDGPLVLNGIVFSYQPGAQPDGDEDAGPPDQLRVLAVFALPETSSALGLVQERRALIQVLQDDPAARGTPPADLRVLQYGATKDSVQAALADAEGWDVIHLAGHGGPGRLYLEDAAGGPEPVETAELLEWLAPNRGRTRLVVLSACESGVARAARIVGARRRPPPQAVTAGATTALGYEVARRLGCTVLAIRYPVDDLFSVALGRMWYEALASDGRPADEAIREILPRALQAAPGTPLSPATTILLGPPGTRVSLPGRRSTDGGNSARAPRQPALAGVPTGTISFTGRTALLGRVGSALAPGPGPGGLVLLGMPGIGKTAVAAEAVHRYGTGFESAIWHRATRRETARSLARALAGQVAAPAADLDVAAISDAIRARDLLLVIDDAQLLVDEQGSWRGELGRLITALTAPGSRSRSILVTDRLLPALPSVISYAVPMLSRSESQWLARERQEARLATGAAGGVYGGLTWLVSRGHPELIEYCSGGLPEQIRRRTQRIDEAWEITTPLAPGTATARHPLGRDHPGTRLGAWAQDRTAVLPGPARRALTFLAAIEQADRIPDHTELAWQLLAADTETDTGPLDEAVGPAEQAGLVERSGTGRFLLHPAVVQSARTLDPELYRHTARAMYVIWDRYYHQAQDEAGHGKQRVLAQCTAAEVPYLMWLGEWELASRACERAINHDGSPATAGRLLPYDVQIVQAAEGTAAYPAVLFVYTNLVRTLDEGRGRVILTRLLEQATRDGDELMVMFTASALATMLAGRDPSRAYELLQQARASRTAAEHQAWADIRLRNIEAQLRFELGDWAGSLAQSQTVLNELAQLTPADMAGWAVNPHSEREVALTYAEASSSALGGHQQAAGFRAQLRANDQGSGQRAASSSGFNEITELIRVGRLDEAYELLVAALAEFSEPGDTGRQGLVLIGLARVEHLRGQPTDAITFGRRALRASYMADQPFDAAAAHGSIANFLAAGPATGANEAPVHILAAAVTHMRVSQGLLAFAPPQPARRALARLTYCLARQPELIPRSFAELRERLQDTTEVDIETLLAGLDRVPVTAGPEPGTLSFALGAQAPPPGDSVTDALTWASHQPPSAELTDVEGHLQHWQPIIEMASTAARGDLEAQQAIRQLLDDFQGMGWSKLANELRAFLTDPQAFTPHSSLPAAEHTIMRHVLEASRKNLP